MTWIGRFSILLISFLAACGMQPERDSQLPTTLALFTESRVTVEIVLRSDENNQAWLEATFTPEDGYRLYSKDIPPGGIDGLGRPTLLELLPGSQMIPTGALTESIGAQEEAGLEGLLTYPEGPVRLSLPIQLPEGKGWVDETISVTYMACRTGTCVAPVINKLVTVRVPGAEEFQIP
jgi:hypothetical protein